MPISLSDAQRIVRETRTAVGTGGGTQPRPPSLSPGQQDGDLTDEDLFGGGGEETPEERRKREAEEFGFDPRTYGLTEDYNLPPGWTVNRANGALIPPGGGEVQTPEDEILPGELFELNGALYQWNGRTITEASAAEERGFMPAGETRAGLRGTAGGVLSGGGGDATAWANIALRREELEESKRNNEFERAYSYITALTQEQQAADDRKQAYINTLLAAGPNLAAGRDFYGGFGQFGGGTLLERLQGGAGIPIRTQVTPLPLPDRRPADTALIESMLGGLV